MTVAILLSLFGGSFIGALLPIVSVELIVALAARELGGGVWAGVLVALTAAVGTMAGKLQVYLVGRGGRAVGGRWVRRQSERQVSTALLAAHRHDAQEPGQRGKAPAIISAARWIWLRLRRMLAGPSLQQLAAPVVLLSGFVGIPPFTIVAPVAGISRMRWQVFATAGLIGRVLRFFVVYEAAALALGRS